MPDLIPTIIPNTESVSSNPASKTERPSIKEIVPSPTSTPAPVKDADDDVTTTSVADTTSATKVVNKTKEPEVLHSVDANADTLTTIADKEEEEFIKEVIKEHQDGSK